MVAAAAALPQTGCGFWWRRLTIYLAATAPMVPTTFSEKANDGGGGGAAPMAAAAAAGDTRVRGKCDEVNLRSYDHTFPVSCPLLFMVAE